MVWEERQAELEARRRELDEEAAEKRAAKEAEKREAEATRKRYDRLLKSLHPMREKDDLETYITGMEHMLQQCQVEEAEWVFYLTVNLSGRYATLVHGLTIDEDDGYETVKGRLLEAAGFMTTDVGSKLLAMDSRDIKRKTGLEVFQYIYRLVKRVFKGAEKVHDFILALMMPVFRRKEGIVFLDQRAPKSLDDLLDTIQQWWAIAKGTTDESESKPRFHPSSSSHFGPPKCFHCLKPGHRANECRAKLAGEPPKFSPTTAGKLDPGKITCYSCGKVGHKASFCPDKGSGAKANPKVAAKRASSWRTTNEYVVRGLVGEKEFDFVLDTGASVCIVPESLVDESEYVHDTVVVLDANGGTVRRTVAKVKLQVYGLCETKEVAVAPDDVLGGKAILALNLGDPLDVEVLLKNVPGGATYPVKAVSTRAAEKQVAEEKADEATCIVLEKPTCKAPMPGPAQVVVEPPVV